MEKPKVSIIVPVYKVEAFLEQCIESILNQSYGDYEIILVDDGSPDRCPEICDQYAKEYGQISVIHKKNGGLSSARLAGFEKARGEYILFVDSDDTIETSMVGELVFAMENVDAELAICGYHTVLNDVKTAKILPYEDGYIIKQEEILRNYINPLVGSLPLEKNIPGFLCIRMHKKSLMDISFFQSERVFYKEDHVFDLLYADSVKNITIVNKPLYNYYMNPASLSNCYRKNKWEMYMNLYYFYEKYLKERNIIGCEVRLNYYLLASLFASIDNAVLSGEYKKYNQEIKEIVQSELAKKALDFLKSAKMSKMQKVIGLLLRNKRYGLLYILRKSRLNQSKRRGK